MGHILYALKIPGDNKLENTNFDDKFVRVRGGLSSDRLGSFQRQTKYKLQALMEMGLINDDRDLGQQEKLTLALTTEGKKLYLTLKPIIDITDLSFSVPKDDIPSWNMKLNPQDFNAIIWKFISNDKTRLNFVRKLFLSTPAASQMLNYLYRIERKKLISKSSIYQDFFNSLLVKRYCEQHGIVGATEEGARHRCPFLLNILESIGILEQSASEVKLKKFFVSKQTVQFEDESEDTALIRVNNIRNFLAGDVKALSSYDESLLKENFGSSFLTDKFYLKQYEVES